MNQIFGQRTSSELFLNLLFVGFCGRIEGKKKKHFWDFLAFNNARFFLFWYITLFFIESTLHPLQFVFLSKVTRKKLSNRIRLTFLHMYQLTSVMTIAFTSFIFILVFIKIEIFLYLDFNLFLESTYIHYNLFPFQKFIEKKYVKLHQVNPNWHKNVFSMDKLTSVMTIAFTSFMIILVFIKISLAFKFFWIILVFFVIFFSSINIFNRIHGMLMEWRNTPKSNF